MVDITHDLQRRDDHAIPRGGTMSMAHIYRPNTCNAPRTLHAMWSGVCLKALCSAAAWRLLGLALAEPAFSHPLSTLASPSAPIAVAPATSPSSPTHDITLTGLFRGGILVQPGAPDTDSLSYNCELFTPHVTGVNNRARLRASLRQWAVWKMRPSAVPRSGHLRPDFKCESPRQHVFSPVQRRLCSPQLFNCTGG